MPLLPLRRLRPAPPAVPPALTVATADGPVEIPVRVSTRARRLWLRVEPDRGGIELVVPGGAKLADAASFAQANAGWIAARLARLPVRVPFAPDAVVPILGRPTRLVHAGLRGVPARLDGDRLLIAGAEPHFARRVGDFLKGRARAEIAPRAQRFAQAVERPVGGLRLGDAKTRWGSCTARGDLNFSWRLVLAPEPVLTYVVAHEVAHLVELNHSIRFWRVVDRLVPDARTSRAWLKAHGAELLKYG
jgi:predicted metal-dependent hydrolase